MHHLHNHKNRKKISSDFDNATPNVKGWKKLKIKREQG